MKKTLTIVVLFIIFVIIYFLQSNFFNWFNIAGVKPNLFVILVLVIGLFTNKRLALPLAIIFGLILDFTIGIRIGICAIMLGSIAYLGTYLNKNFLKDSRIHIMLMTAIATLIYEIGIYLFKIILLQSSLEILAFLKILLIEIAFNVILIIILYPTIQALGNALEKIFVKEKTLSNYY